MTRMMRILGSVALLMALAMPVSAQGVLSPMARLQFLDNNGDPLAGGLIYTYVAGTVMPLAAYQDSALSVLHANPIVLDSAGRATIYLSPTLSYKFTLRDSLSVVVWTQDNIIGPQSGVFTVSAADTRGLRITRTSADAGMSITSVGGSGKTYGLVSDTAGGFTIRDDSDGTPNMQWLGNNITATMTGVFAVAGNQTISGTLGVTGVTTFTGNVAALNHIAVGSGSGTNNSMEIRSSANGLGSGLRVSRSDGSYLILNSEITAAGSIIQAGDGASYRALRLNAAGGSVDLASTSNVVNNAGRYNSATQQPGFLAYNSAIVGVATGGTVNFDTEVYDEAGNFENDTFAAPVTGRYHLCTTVSFSDNSASTYGVRLVTTARTYQISAGTSSALVVSGCVYVDMTAAATALVQVLTGDIDIDIEGGGAPMVTFFSGRLVP